MRRRFSAYACAAAVACAGMLVPLHAHADRVAWNVTIGGPGFAVSAGQPWGGWGAVPAFAPVVAPWAPVVAPAPVLVAPPRVVVRPVAPIVRPIRGRHVRPVVVAAPAFVPAPVFRPAPVVVVRPLW